jgi:hypothetical protein
MLYVIWFVFLKNPEKGTGKKVLKHGNLNLIRDGSIPQRQSGSIISHRPQV